MVEGRQPLMSMVRQFKDNLKISTAISKKSMATGGGHSYLKGLNVLIYMVLFSGIELHL